MKLLDDYFALQEEIFSYFGYVEDWRVLPLADNREYFWYLTGEAHGNEVQFAKTRDELVGRNGDYFVNSIYTQRHLPKWVYRGENYTMIVVDTHTDGNQLLQVFSNAKEVTTL